MEDDSIHKHPQYVVEEIFSRLEEQVVDIARNMVVLMEALVNNFGPFE